MFIDPKELPRVSYEGMNQVHLKELEILNDLYNLLENGSDEEVTEALRSFIEDVKAHFSYEEELMERTSFFAYSCHSEEHRRVLKELEKVEKEWKRGKDRKKLKLYLEKTFKPWISEHILTMDTVTANWISSVLSGLSLKFS